MPQKLIRLEAQHLGWHRARSSVAPRGLRMCRSRFCTAGFVIRICTRSETNGKAPTAYYSIVSPTYFATLGVSIIRGRVFTEQEAGEGAPVVIVSETGFSRRWW